MTRDQILEEAALVCDGIASSYSAHEVSFGIRSDGLFAQAAKECAAKIRSQIPPPAGYNELVESLIIDGSQPSTPNTTGLAAAPTMETMTLPGHQIYKDKDTGEYWVELAWITYPATCLQNLRTDDRIVEIIGCPNSHRFVALGRIESSKLPRTSLIKK